MTGLASIDLIQPFSAKGLKKTIDELIDTCRYELPVVTDA
jgi:hypothetical protein